MLQMADAKQYDVDESVLCTGFLGEKLSLFSFSEHGCGSKPIQWKWSAFSYENRYLHSQEDRLLFERVELNCLGEYICRRCSFTARGGGG